MWHFSVDDIIHGLYSSFQQSAVDSSCASLVAASSKTTQNTNTIQKPQRIPHFFFFSLFFLLLSGIIFFFFLLLHLLPSALCHFSFQNNIMFQQSHFRSIFSSPSFRASMQRGNATHWLITRWLLGDWLSCSCCAWPNRTNAYRKIDFSISFYIGIVVFLFVHRALHTVIYMSKYLNLIFEQILKKGL